MALSIGRTPRSLPTLFQSDLWPVVMVGINLELSRGTEEGLGMHMRTGSGNMGWPLEMLLDIWD